MINILLRFLITHQQHLLGYFEFWFDLCFLAYLYFSHHA